MSDTPRTDAACAATTRLDGMHACFNAIVAHARTLERELSEVIDALRMLVSLKTMKREIEAGTAHDAMRTAYEMNKEPAWAEAEAVLKRRGE